MPTVVTDGEFTFIIHTRELPFEPPHVHIQFGGNEVRIELDGATFMENPPPGKRKSILLAYKRHAKEIRQEWDRHHRKGGTA